MKNNRVSFCILIIILAGGLPASLPRARADEAADQAAATALLTAGPWKVVTKGVGDAWVFAKDGTFTTANKLGGRWTMTKDSIILSFPSGHKEAMTLPLNPKGTACMSDDGSTSIAVMDNPPAVAGSAPAPAVTPAPAIALAPAHAVAGAQQPAPAPRGPIPSKAVTKALLLAKPWKFVGTWWCAIRSFAPDGTFKGIVNGGGDGSWQITDTTVDLLFPDGHKDTMLLPLNPGGCTGIDGRNGPIVLVQGDMPSADPTPPPVSKHTSALDYLRQTPTPGPQEIARKNAATAAALVAAPWKFIGRSWVVMRIFAKDGTFTTVDRPAEYGTWKISANKILLTFTDSHVDMMMLPLNPKGTDCIGQGGGWGFYIMQPSAAGATPAPTSGPPPSTVATTTNPPAPRAQTPPPFGTQQRPQGPTPPPFGRQMPP